MTMPPLLTPGDPNYRRTVEELHRYADTDRSHRSVHHTLGSLPNQASPGNHNHNLVGAMTLFAGSAAPTGWLLCDGSAVSRANYPALFAIIGTNYGVGDGSTTFNLPDLRGRVPVGVDGSNASFNALNKTGGEQQHTLTNSEMPSHDHSSPTGSTGVSHQHTLPFEWVATTTAGGAATRVTDIDNITGGSGTNSSGTTTVPTVSTSHTHSITPQGGGNAHENMPPFVTVNYIIKAA